jgi:alkylated DNA repair dioxygenase AlkB
VAAVVAAAAGTLLSSMSMGILTASALTWQSSLFDGAREPDPRLLASWPYQPGADLLPPILERIRTVLSQRYGRHFDSVHANLYRDGRDSVTWHGDRIAASVWQPMVAIVSLGHPRRFLLRPRGGTAQRTLMLGRGDLLVTGGSTQRTWQHAVPKVAVAGPRISLTLRHSSNDAAAQRGAAS